MILKIAEITLPIFVIVMIGFGYARHFKPDLSGANKLIVDLALPALIFTSLSTKEFDPVTAALFMSASTLLILGSGALALLAVPLTGASWRSFLPCVMFGNVGPVGLPLTVLTYGEQGLAPAVVLLVLSNILHFTLGAGIMSGKADWRMVYANPLLWATVLGVTFSGAGWTLPNWLGTPVGMIANILVPMMLLSLGARLSSSRTRDVRVGVVAAVLTPVIRLAVAAVILWVFPLQGVERGALILFACLPSAVFNFMLADRFHTEPGKVASMVIIGHLGSLIVLPLGIWLALQ